MGSDTLLILVRYDSVGRLDGVRVHGRPGASFDPDGAAAALRERFRPAAAPNRVVAAVFVPGGAPDLRPHEIREDCAPTLVNRPEITRLLHDVARMDRDRNRSIVAWVFSDRHGMVTEAMIDRSSGDIRMDREMLQVARRARFHPATSDGFARPVWIALPLGIDMAPARPPSAPCPPQAMGSFACRGS